MKGKKKMILWILIIAVILVIGFVGIYAMKNKKVDGPDMEYKPSVASIDYCHGPDEYGNVETYSLKGDSFTHSLRELEETVNIGIDFYNSLDEIITKYDMSSWTKLKKNETEMLDGSTTSMVIEFENGNILELGSNVGMPENGWNAVREIVVIFESYLKK